MFRTGLFTLLLLSTTLYGSNKIMFSFSPNYSYDYLYQDEQEPRGEWGVGGELEIRNFVSHIGLKFRGSRINYSALAGQNPYEYEYIPISLCTSLDLLPFFAKDWLGLTMETGLGIYFWRGLSNGALVVLPDGSTMDEIDLGFVGGFTIQLRPIKYIGLEYATRYNYIASSNLYKYGYYDKDEKIWEHGVGIKIILP